LAIDLTEDAGKGKGGAADLALLLGAWSEFSIFSEKKRRVGGGINGFLSFFWLYRVTAQAAEPMALREESALCSGGQPSVWMLSEQSAFLRFFSP
jgi:hypothetical protein